MASDTVCIVPYHIDELENMMYLDMRFSDIVDAMSTKLIELLYVDGLDSEFTFPMYLTRCCDSDRERYLRFTAIGPNDAISNWVFAVQDRNDYPERSAK